MRKRGKKDLRHVKAKKRAKKEERGKKEAESCCVSHKPSEMLYGWEKEAGMPVRSHIPHANVTAALYHLLVKPSIKTKRARGSK